MTILGQVTMQDPNRAGHIGGIDSGNINPLYQDEHFGAVEKRVLKESFFRAFINMRPVRGTDTLTKPRMGHTPLQKLNRGIRAVDHSPTYDNVSIKVDTIILARANEWTLEDFQNSYDFRTEIGAEQGKEIGKYFDEACCAQAIKAAQITVVHPDGTKDGGWEGLAPTNIERSAPEGHRGGTCIVFAGANDHEDPDQAERAMSAAMVGLRKKDVDVGDMVWIMNWDFHNTLSYNTDLITTDLNGFTNGEYSMRTVDRVAGVMLNPNNRMPSEINVRNVNDHYLSNAANNWAYNNTANDVLCEAALVHPKTLLGGETIPITTKIFWDDKDKQWYIDAWTAFAVTPDRAEYAAAIFRSTVS